MDERTDGPEQAPGLRSGRVRIIGAQAAGDVADGAQTPAPLSEGVPAVPAAGTQEGDTPADQGGRGGTDAGSEELPWPTAEPEMAHWTEAPTGEVPAVLYREPEAGGEIPDQWSSVPAPAWREERADWSAGEASFEPSMLAEDEARLGSLGEPTGDERRPWEFDLPERAEPIGEAPSAVPDGRGQVPERAQPEGEPSLWYDEPTATVPVVRAHEPLADPYPTDNPYTTDHPHTAERSGSPEPEVARANPVLSGADHPYAVTSGPHHDPYDVGISPAPASGDAGQLGGRRADLADTNADTGIGTGGGASFLYDAEEMDSVPVDQPPDAPPTWSPGPVAAEGPEWTDLAGVTTPPGDATDLYDEDTVRHRSERRGPASPGHRRRGRRGRRVRDEPAAVTGALMDQGPLLEDDTVVSPPPPPPPPPRRRPRAAEPAPSDPVAARTGGQRNVGTAVVTGVGVGIVALICFAAGNALSLVLVALVVTLAAAEAYSAFRRAGHHSATLLGLVAVLALMIAAYNRGQQAEPLIAVLLVAFTAIWYLVGVQRVPDPVPGVAVTVLVFTWIGVFGSYGALLLNPTLFPDRHGIAFLLGAVIAAVAYDVGALAVGSWVGRRPLSPTISPHKTWEGLIGGSLVAIVVSAIVVQAIHPWNLGDALLLGIVVSIVSPIGDLWESVIKRHLGLKDMGRLLPGHGGVLDRVDGMLFILPATYYLVKAVHLG